MSRHVVASVEEIAPGTCKVVTIKGREIGVFNVNNEFFALINRCPHQGAPLCRGAIVSRLVAPSPGDTGWNGRARCCAVPGIAGNLTSAPDNPGAIPTACMRGLMPATSSQARRWRRGRSLPKRYQWKSSKNTSS